jgi:hypothetical protein
MARYLPKGRSPCLDISTVFFLRDPRALVEWKN